MIGTRYLLKKYPMKLAAAKSIVNTPVIKYPCYSPNILTPAVGKTEKWPPSWNIIKHIQIKYNPGLEAIESSETIKTNRPIMIILYTDLNGNRSRN